MDDPGKRISENGWRQGAILHAHDHDPPADGNETMAVVVSHSCDVTCDCLTTEPHVEAIPAKVIECEDGNCTYAKNPRCLHLRVHSTDGSVSTIELQQRDRYTLPREHLLGCSPDEERFIDAAGLRTLGRWLALRYERSALPDAFNMRLARLRKKTGKLHKRMSPHVSGLYVQLEPHDEISADAEYRINLLALVPASHRSAIHDVRLAADELADLLRGENMHVQVAAMADDQISHARVSRMHRLPLEHLSLRHDPEHPMPEY